MEKTNALYFINKYYYQDISFKILDKNCDRKEVLRRAKYQYAKENKKYKNRFFPKIENIFKPYYVFDMTDTEEYDCYICDVLLHKDQPILDDDVELIKALNGVRLDLMIYFSVLSPYYYYFIIETRYDFVNNNWSFKDIYGDYSEIKKQLIQLQEIMGHYQYSLMSKSVASCNIPELELEYVDKGKATVFDCLFTQILGPKF